MAENAYFFSEENDDCLQNCVTFAEKELLEISENLDDG